MTALLADTFQGVEQRDDGATVLRTPDGRRVATIHHLGPALGLDRLFLAIRERDKDGQWWNLECRTAVHAESFTPALTSWGFTRKAATS